MKRWLFTLIILVLGGLLLAACNTAPTPGTLETQAVGEVCFYEHSNYQGRSFCASDSNAWVGNRDNDIVSSVRVESSAEVTLFQDINFGGRSLELTQDTPMVPLAFNDLASSFKITQLDPTDPDPDPEPDPDLAATCTPEIRVEVEDEAAAQPLLDIYPEAIVQPLALEVCSTLYNTAEEARAPATIILNIVNEPGGYPAFASPGLPVAEYTINMAHLNNYQGDAFVEEFEGITAHELTHVYQNFGRGASTGLTEGIADYVRFTVGYTPPGAQPDKDGNWDDGYRTTAFFLIWVEERNPGFVRKLNLAIGAGGFNVDDAFTTLTGKTPDQLWADYVEDDGTPDPDPDPDPEPDTALDAKCTPEITLNLEDKNAYRSGLFLDVAGDDPEAFLQDIGRKVCRILYKEASEVRDANRLELIIRNSVGDVAWKSGNIGDITIMISTDHLKNVDQAGRDVAKEIKGILFHEMTHMYQQDDNDGGGADLGIIEGIADFVRIKSGYIPRGARPNKNGNWNDGYTTTAFFLVWLDEAYSDFAYELNKSMDNNDGERWTPAAFEEITGKPVNQLWQEYVNDG